MVQEGGGLVGTYWIDDGRKAQIVVWLMKDETSLVGGYEWRMGRRRRVVILFGGIGHLIRIVQRGKGKVRNLLEGSCIPPRLVYQMGIGPSRLEFGFLYYPVRTLLDSDASSSFISSLLVESLHLDTSLVDYPLVVSNPIGAP